MNLTRSGILFLVLLLFCSGCDKGLAPLNEPSGFSGVIRFKNWPQNVYELRLLAFSKFPSDSASLLLTLLGGGAAVIPAVGTPGFPKDGRDSLQYSFTTEGSTLQVGNYEYIVFAWRYGTGLFSDWRPAGVYTLSPSTFTPTPVRVLLHRIQPNVDILVDFNNPPPRPWR